MGQDGDDRVGYEDLISCIHSETHTTHKNSNSHSKHQQQQQAAEAIVIIHHQLGVMGCIEHFFFGDGGFQWFIECFVFLTKRDYYLRLVLLFQKT